MVKKNTESHEHKHHEPKEQVHHEHKKKTDYGKIVFFSLLGIVVIVFASQFLFNGGNDEPNTPPTTPPGELSGLDAFAQCLTDNDAVFYGTEWCGFCNQQKTLFGDSLKYVNYIDCDKNTNVCTAQGIRGYPTWKVKGEPLVGVQSLQALASKTGCQL
jgi:hypothetical protein